MIQIREIRSQPGNISKNYRFEWDLEGGTRFYNGIKPGSIIGYAATRFEREYPDRAFEEHPITWSEFYYPIGI